MNFLSRTTDRHNAASLMLAVWLFVLASGFANACLLEASVHAHQPSSESSHINNHVAAIEHESERSSNAPCLKACDAGAHALQSSNGIDSIDPGSPPSATVIWTGMAPLSTRHRSGFEIPPSLSDPPKRIGYSRWAL